MLADSDRQEPSVDLQVINPTSAGDLSEDAHELLDVELQPGTEEPQAESIVVSEHLLAKFDSQLSRGENSPTPLFYFCAVASIPRLQWSKASSVRLSCRALARPPGYWRCAIRRGKH